MEEDRNQEVPPAVLEGESHGHNNNDFNADEYNNSNNNNESSDVESVVESEEAEADRILMELSKEERNWALAIKRADQVLLQDEDATTARCRPLTDMEYAEMALVTRGNTEEAFKRIQGLQTFWRDYQVDHSPEQGVHYLQALMELQPGMILHLDINADTNEAIRIMDYSVINPDAILAPSLSHGAEYHWKRYMNGLYYLYVASQPSLATVRAGLHEIADCEGFEWSNFSMDIERRHYDEMYQFFPVKFNNTIAYNTGSVANLFWSLMKPVMQDQAKAGLLLGRTLDENGGDYESRRLSDIYLKPNLEEAQQNLLRTLTTLLSMRAGYEATFRLEGDDDPDASIDP